MGLLTPYEVQVAKQKLLEGQAAPPPFTHTDTITYQLSNGENPASSTGSRHSLWKNAVGLKQAGIQNQASEP